jgi:NAD(P)-dependent dehydrogenase (short-subunit alcohol dehydrogenase family)
MPKVAVVTGASRGLGRALATEAAERGYLVAGFARSGCIGLQIGTQLDVLDHDGVERFAARVAQELGPIDLWVNNAAVLGPVGSFVSTTYDDWMTTIGINVVSLVQATKVFVRHRNDASILLNIGSRAATTSPEGLTPYSASKAAVTAATIGAAPELARGGVRAHVVAPPSFLTEMQQQLLDADPAVYPAVAEHKRRLASGATVTPEAAARRIFEAVIDRPEAPTVVDLTT